MATLNQFQVYSQKENVVTNNVLLMFSTLYELNPKYYEELIDSLTEDSEGYRIIPNFLQQIGKGGSGVVDGMISMTASKIIIETKLNSKEYINKLLQYTDRFIENERKILFHISTTKYSKNEISTISQNITDKTISFFSLTFEEITQQLSELAKSYYFDIHLKKLNENFTSYCKKEGLLPRKKPTLRAMACGGSFEINKKYAIYFDLASRGFSDFDYLGIYKQKSVRFIGKVENEVIADYINNELTIYDDNQVSAQQKERIINAIKETKDMLGWDIASGHRFFLLYELSETDFKKVSAGGIFRVRHFTLKDYLRTVPSSAEEIAQQLRKITWE